MYLIIVIIFDYKCSKVISMNIHSKQNQIFLILSGIFITNAVIAELIGGKLIQIGPFVMSVGVIPWPIVFLTTDLMNEYYGRNGVRKLTLLTSILIVYTFIILYLSMQVSSVSFSPVSDEQFKAVFGQSMWIITGSIVAFLVSQWVDVFIFWMIRDKTGKKWIWIRATGSTAISQLVDTFVILGIAFWLPGKIKNIEFLNLAVTNYSYKLIIAIGLTPAIYLGHALIDWYIGKKDAEELIISATFNPSKPEKY